MFEKKPWEGFEKRNLDKRSIIFLVLVVFLVVLSYLNFSTGSYLKILQGNLTSLKANLEACKNESSSLKSDLNLCNQDLDSCQGNLTEKTQALLNCQSLSGECEKNYASLKSNYTSCKDRLDGFYSFLDEKGLSDLTELRERWNEMKEDLSNCLNDLGDYEALRDNYVHYKCCVANATVYKSYDINNNEVWCRNDTSGEFTLSC